MMRDLHWTRALLGTAVALLLAGGLAAGEGPQEWTREESIERARQELARILSAEEAEIEFVEAKAVEWRDSSLGCPSKATVYQPVIVPGYRITFTARAGRHRVHTGLGQAVVCTTGYRQTTPLPQRDETRLTLYRLAVEDLTKRLGVPVSHVTLLGIAAREFTAAELECWGAASEDEAPENQDAETGSIAGWVIQLAADGAVHRYHAAGERVVLCPAAPAHPEAEATVENGDG
jgi:hypothetical protein